MYLISAYFDDNSSKTLQRYINKIADKTGNTYMVDKSVPPHMTLLSIEAKNVEVLVPYFEKMQDKFCAGGMKVASVGMLMPYVIYAAPVLNKYLIDLMDIVYDGMSGIPDTMISRYYKPLQWMPHITLGKKMSKEQMQTAVGVLRDEFVPFEAEIVQIGLAKVNPHIDVVTYNINKTQTNITKL